MRNNNTNLPGTYSRWTIEEWQDGDNVVCLRGDVLGNDQLDVLKSARASLDRLIASAESKGDSVRRSKHAVQQDGKSSKLVSSAYELTPMDIIILERLVAGANPYIKKIFSDYVVYLANDSVKTLKSQFIPRLLSDNFWNIVEEGDQAGADFVLISGV